MTFPYAILGDDDARIGVNKEDARANLYEVRRLTGFRWEVLADLLRVTRRTVYNWSQGGPVAEDSKLHLANVLDVLRYMDRGQAELNTIALYEPGRNGDPFWLLKCQRFDEARRTLGKGRGRPALPAVNDPRVGALGLGYFTDEGDGTGSTNDLQKTEG